MLVNHHHLLVVPVEESSSLAVLEVLVRLSNRLVPNHNSSGLFETFDRLFADVIIQIFDNQHCLDPSAEGVHQFLKRDASNHRVVHSVSRDAHDLLCFVEVIPKRVPELV